MDNSMESHYIETNGVKLHVIQSGPKDGPVILFLHGFPEFWFGWRRQISYFAEKGYRVWAPDLRGYNLSEKPKGMSSYHIDLLTDDVLGLIDASGQEKVVLCGHDWGAFLAWSVAGKHPERIEKLVILNVPHESVMKRNLRRNPIQMLKSLYILFFQLPWIPEASAKLMNWKPLVMVMTRSSRAGTFSEADFNRYRDSWSQPHAYHSMLNWYRAFVQMKRKTTTSERIAPPVLIMWGKQDQFLSAKMAEESIRLCDQGELVFIEDATHWVQHEEADQVNARIDEFIMRK